MGKHCSLYLPRPASPVCPGSATPTCRGCPRSQRQPATKEGHLPRQISESRRNSGRPPTPTLASLVPGARLRGASLRGCTPRPGGAPTRTSEANLQREFPSAVCTPLFSHTGSELSDLRAGSFLGCPWVLIIAWPLSPHFLSHGPRAERGCVVTPVCWLRRFPMTRGALGC